MLTHTSRITSDHKAHSDWLTLAPPHRCFLIMDRPVWTSSNPSISFSSSTHTPSRSCSIRRPIPCSIPSLMAPCWAQAVAWQPNKLCPPPSLDQSLPRPLLRSHTQGEYTSWLYCIDISETVITIIHSLHTHFPFSLCPPTPTPIALSHPPCLSQLKTLFLWHTLAFPIWLNLSLH